MIISVIVLVLILYREISCQVCVETKMSWRDVPETYLYTYLEAYEKTNCLFFCTATRVATAVGTRSIRKQVAEQTNVCCQGYIQEEPSLDHSIHCKPVCSPSCVNGYCKSPDVCACETGFIPDPKQNHTCIPLCLKGCDYGTCEAPNSCICDPGYETVDGICEPICLEPCHNGTCVAPDNCKCLPGYEKSENGTCEPKCSSHSDTGECLDIDTLLCDPGWKEVEEWCEPICTDPCVNGTCVAPETCECLYGYVKTIEGNCLPYCSSGCPHGSCVSPETCVCDPGWFKRASSEECFPHCDRVCGNGFCVEPNVCECFPGNIFDVSKDISDQLGYVCVPFCENCEGLCVIYEECTCDWPKVPTRVTFDGEYCNCEENCSNEENLCQRTKCLLTMTTRNDITTEITEEATILISSTTTSTTFGEYETTTHKMDRNHYKLKVQKASWNNSSWFYGIGAVVLATILIVIIASILKRKFSKSFDSRITFSVNDGVNPSSAVHYKQNPII